MTKVDSTQLASYCTDISNDVHDAFPHLDLHFLIYQEGEKADKIARLLPHLASHPARDEAASILKFKTIGKDYSGFLGLADAYETVHLRLKNKKKKSMAFIALNLSQYETFEDAVHDAHFFTAHLIEVLARQKNTNFKKDKLDICRTNLKSDIYAILKLSTEGKYESARLLARQRSIETLTPQSSIKPENNPFPLALDVITHTLDNNILFSLMSRTSFPMIAQFQLAQQITSCFEDENLESWINFTNNSQTMAWSGFSASQILGAAVNTSTDPFIKAIGHLLSELTNLSPIAAEHISQGYNPFIPDEINFIHHERLVDDTFEMTLIHVVEAESSLPLLRVANNQNEALLKGKISGWCAHALQAAAKAFDDAKRKSIPAEQAARLEFQSALLQSNWSQLTDTKRYIIQLLRAGNIADFPALLKSIENNPNATFLLDSVLITLEDPKFSKQEDIVAILSTMKPSELLSLDGKAK